MHRDTLFEFEVDGELIVTTEDHPFWSVTGQAWEDTEQLDAGELVLAADGRTLTVTREIGFGSHRIGDAYNLTVAGLHTYHVGVDGVLVHNTGGIDGCSDAAYQGVHHLRDEIAKEGPGGVHSWAAKMSDDELADYLDGFVTRGGGQPLKGGGVGWYDPDRGIGVIQRSEYSMTGYSMSYETFLGKLR